ncbi:MAG: hypothetical protein RR619_11495, partial [Raoultibacter sp.]
RLEAAAQTLKPLFRQTVVPDAVELWLAEDEFEGETAESLECLRDLVEAGLVVKWCEKSLKPHNKYFWALQQHPDDIVITIDDDIIYPPSLIQHLLEMHYRHPHAVIANRTHIVTGKESGELAPYKSWRFEQCENFDAPRFDMIATGVGGVLYPPNVFDAEVFNETAVRDTSVMADDLWLMVHELRLNIPVVNTWVNPGLTYIPDTQESGLYLENLENGRNDAILQCLFERYPETEVKLKRLIKERGESQTSPEAPLFDQVKQKIKTYVGR